MGKIQGKFLLGVDQSEVKKSALFNITLLNSRGQTFDVRFWSEESTLCWKG